MNIQAELHFRRQCPGESASDRMMEVLDGLERLTFRDLFRNSADFRIADRIGKAISRACSRRLSKKQTYSDPNLLRNRSLTRRTSETDL